MSLRLIMAYENHLPENGVDTAVRLIEEMIG
jgi:hypothetical protein